VKFNPNSTLQNWLGKTRFAPTYRL